MSYQRFAELCRDGSEGVVARLKLIALTERGPRAIRAAELLFAYGWGRPVQRTEVEVKEHAQTLLEAMIQKARERRAAAAAGTVLTQTPTMAALLATD